MEAIRAGILSDAWLAAARRLLELPGYETCDLVVEIERPLDEDETVRRALDQHLIATKKQSIETVASTIFPERMWRPSMGRIHFYESYQRVLPKLHRFPGNHRGLYFERLTLWPTRTGGTKNQVEDVIQRLRSQLQRENPLRFVYDLLVFSPEADPVPMGFPCLSFINIKLFKGQLFMAAHYRNHYFVERTYGNYLGLARLQRFIAHQSGVETGPLVCVSGHAVLDDHRVSFKQLLTKLAAKDAE